MNSTIVSSKWLSDNFDSPNLVVLDASQPRTKSESISQQIIGARPFDIKGAFCDKSSFLPNTFPSKEQFEDPDLAKLFKVEKDILSLCDHPRIVKYIDGYGEGEAGSAVVLQLL